MVASEIDGWFDWAEFYEAIVCGFGPQDGLPHNAKIVEVGAWHGKSTVFLANLLKYRRPDITLFSVDRWNGVVDAQLLEDHTQCWKTFLDNLTKYGVLEYVIPLRMESVDAACHFKPHSLDFVYLDGSHDYWSVKADILAWKPKLVAGGILAGHDWNLESVQKAVSETLGGPRNVTGNTWVVKA